MGITSGPEAPRRVLFLGDIMKKSNNLDWLTEGITYWPDDLAKALEEDGAEHFGHNVEVDAKKYFRKLDSLGCGYLNIRITDSYTATVDLSEMHNIDLWHKEEVLLHILTTSPLPTEVRHNKKKDILTLEWHY